MFVFAGGDLVQRIVIVDAEEITGVDPFGFEGLKDRVVNQDSAKSSHVHAARGGLGVIDNLRAAHASGYFFGPEHRHSKEKGWSEGKRNRRIRRLLRLRIFS